MRYRFRGLVRATGKPVEGHVEAENEELAFHVLANNGIMPEGAIRPDPRPEDRAPIRLPVDQQTPPPQAQPAPAAPLLPPLPPRQPAPVAAAPQASSPAATLQPSFAVQSRPMPATPAMQQPANDPSHDTMSGTPQFTSAIDSALNTSSSQIEFDALTERFRGKKVWVIDREKIKLNVAQVVDEAIAQSLKNAESGAATRERVADAINDLFKDNRNITSQANQTNQSLDKQIGRLANVIKQFEGALANMQMAIRGIGSGGGGGFTPRRYIGQQHQGLREEQNAVLLEIFKSNLDLLRNMEDEMRQANTAADSTAA